ncbi:hypothetical protein [Amycolatopsis nigrescens]|uniref:hypothetical protein n=1 Tax=Amycolatopsis nigrescens TaxID=381445 RepID=UPI0003694B0B|nr:hypothetical protein [Amycolatopsis nigrescens]
MSRRASLPGASELFRLTGNSPAFDTPPPAEQPPPAREKASSNGRKEQLPQNGSAARRGSGRQKHDAKITVYVSGDELLAMEHARLALRGSHELVVDRGRLVREAVAVLLADFDQNGADSVLVRRLRGGGVEAESPGATN